MNIKKLSARLFAAFALFTLLIPCEASAKAIYRPDSEVSISLAQMSEELYDAKIITIGERHDSPEDHAAQRTIIQALHEAGQKLSIGFEMFQASSQPTLDNWINGKIYPSAIADVFNADWDASLFALYQPIFLYAKQEGIPLVGLNVDRKIVAEIMKNGSDGLSDADWRKYGDLSCDVNPMYAVQILGAMSHATEMTAEQKERLCRAQVAWDYSMAKNALDYLKKNPDRTLMIIAGGYHAWRHGIPEQAARIDELPVKVILTNTDSSRALKITPAEADYIFMSGVFR